MSYLTTWTDDYDLSVMSGLAFHPLDGILQAVPHVIALFLVPTHLTSHIALLFLEAIWTANIHDCIHAKAWPVMGAGYHTIHHTTYRHNYGHYTIWMDWMFGTLRDPQAQDDESKVMWCSCLCSWLVLQLFNFKMYSDCFLVRCLCMQVILVTSFSYMSYIPWLENMRYFFISGRTNSHKSMYSQKMEV